MNKRLSILALALACSGPSFAATVQVTLTENSGMGKTFSETADARLEWSSKVDRNYNFGGATTMQAGLFTGTGYYSVSLVRFDLSSLSEVGTVVSGKLRIYQTSADTANKAVQRVLEDWQEGTGISWGDANNGVTAYSRYGGRNVLKESLTATIHAGEDVWYFDGVDDLAATPVDGKGHYIARLGTSTHLRNYDLGNYRLRQESSLDNLVTNAVGTYAYCYDADADRVYLRFNSAGVGWLKNSDLWLDSVWDGTETLGPNNSSVDATQYPANPAPAADWNEFDITEIVTEWLVEGQPNHGVRLVRKTNYGSTVFATSEAADGLRPELVIQYTPKPPAGTFVLVK